MAKPIDPAVTPVFEHARSAFRWACWSDVMVRKPGNVSIHSPGHAMQAEQFLTSAEASLPGLFALGAKVGARIESAVRATRAAVACNTNLGILLLCAPLAAAAERSPRSDCTTLLATLSAVLAELGIDDARAAFRAIAEANPGGLGKAAEQDVGTEPDIGLVEAMALAADRDMIARQYANGFADLCGFGLDALRASQAMPGMSHALAVQRLYLGWLAREPDSHIARKFGVKTACGVSGEARVWLQRLSAEASAADSADFMRWDESLKTRGLNPGTSADLTVATLFLAALCDPALCTEASGTDARGLL